MLISLQRSFLYILFIAPIGLMIYFIYGIHNSVEGKDDDPIGKDKIKLVMPPPPENMYDMKQIQPESDKQPLDDFDEEDEPRSIAN